MSASAEQKRVYKGPALFSVGLRPFFLLGAIWAALAVPLWIVTYSLGPDAMPFETGLGFHVHEMVFGYGSAIVAGFLLTAVPNWTGRQPINGVGLMGLAALWCAGRIAMLVSPHPNWLGAFIEAAFLVVFAVIIWREVLLGKNQRNMKVAAAISCFALANIGFHWSAVVTGGIPTSALNFGIAILLFLNILIGGRIIPSFTSNWLKKMARPISMPFEKFDAFVLIVSGVGLFLWSMWDSSKIVGAVLVAIGLLNVVRLTRWRGFSTFSEPLVLILHVGYGWTSLALILIGLSVVSPSIIPTVAGIHAAGVGAVGVMTLAVMSRASLGHTGRELTAGSATTVIYVLINAAAISRVLAVFMEHPMQQYTNYISAILWAGAFISFSTVYGPKLWAPRL